MAAIEGRNGRFQVAGVNANVEQFDGDLSTDRVDATGFEDQNSTTGRTAQVVTDGIDMCKATVNGYVDAAAMPASFGFSQGTVLVNVFLYLHKTGGGGLRRIAMPYAKVFKVRYSVKVRDKIMFSLDIESTGAFTGPV